MPSKNQKVQQQQFSTAESCFFFLEHCLKPRRQLLQATKFGLKFTFVSFQFSTLALHTPPPQSAWEGGAQRSLHRNHHFRHHHHCRHLHRHHPYCHHHYAGTIHSTAFDIIKIMVIIFISINIRVLCLLVQEIKVLLTNIF